MSFFLPNIFTTLNLFCGFYAIICVIHGLYNQAALLIFASMFFDIFDGKIARLTKNTSPFGVEYDSLSDLVSFGIAPSLLIYNTYLHEFGKIGWLTSFLFTACVALRLARFNIKPHSSLHNFEGLPSPAAGVFIAATVLFFQENNISIKWPLIVLLFALSYLMISSISYPSFKTFNIKKTQIFFYLVLFTLFLIIFFLKPIFFSFLILFFYIFCLPLLLFLKSNLIERKQIFKKIDKI